MRIAYLECSSGVSGDMFLGALVDAGVPVKLLEETVAKLNIGATLDFSRVDRSGITASKVDVLEGPGKKKGEKHSHAKEDHSHEHDHSHGHSHEHGNTHSHEHDHGHSHDTGRAATLASHVHGRGLKEIKKIIRAATIGEKAKRTAIAIFDALGAAEAKIHNTDIEKIHFHEVGAVDAMVDIVCAAVGAEALDVADFICSPLNVGGGTVECAHGTIPVPAPATVELLRGAPIFSSGPQVELVTPTGAAIVKVLATRFASFPQMKIEKSGYGAGSKDFPGHANVVRLVIGEAFTENPTKTSQDTIEVLEANLDDLNPQVFGYVLDRLLAEGALDVFGVPLLMKKNRPGTLLTVLCRPIDAARLTQIIFAETTTLGVRRREEKRQILTRKWQTVVTQWGEVRMKVAGINGTVTNYAPEYEDCRKIAFEQHVPLKSVMEGAVQGYLRGLEKN
jgi:uncharacterized protein (TIGR00299 family) protein